MPYRVEYETAGGDEWSLPFATEREAREWINARADGSIIYWLRDSCGVIVASAWPVLMVA
jgi:hypothetical protein